MSVKLLSYSILWEAGLNWARHCCFHSVWPCALQQSVGPHTKHFLKILQLFSYFLTEKKSGTISLEVVWGIKVINSHPLELKLSDQAWREGHRTCPSPKEERICTSLWRTTPWDGCWADLRRVSECRNPSTWENLEAVNNESVKRGCL